MFSKSGIMAQEFKEQLGDRMPTAMRALEKSTGKTAKELFKMMEMGQLGAEYILPFTRALRSLSSEGGALEKALKTLRVEENRLINQSKLAGDKIFKSGFSEGLSELYKTISEILKNAGPQLEKLGDIFGKVFKGIAHILRVVEPYLKLVIDNFEVLFGAGMLLKIKAMGLALARTFLPLTAAVAAAEELASLMSDKLVGGIEKQAGMQINLMNRTTSGLKEKDGKYYKSGTPQEFFGLGAFGEYTLKGVDMMNPFKTGANALNNLFGSSTPNTTNNSGGNTFIFQDSDMGTVKRALDYAGISGVPTSK